jgi:hypothetical protein
MRRGRFLLAVACAAVASACGDSSSGGGAGGSARATRSTGFQGRFRGTTPGGAITLRLETAGDAVRVTSPDGTVTGRLVAPDRVEGSEAVEQGGGSFVLVLAGDRLTATFTVADQEGRTQTIGPVTLERAAEPERDAPRDAALVGRWRHTESHASGGLSMATDVHLELAADGTYATWSRSAGIGDPTETPRTTGSWKTEAGRLYLWPDDADAWREKGAYAVSDQGLLLTYGPGNKQVFERL